MKRSIYVICFFLFAHAAYADIHVIFYATCNGKTGHCGLAIDEYQVMILEKKELGKILYYPDSVKTGALTYYDLWPLKDVYKGQYDGDVEPIYYKLPSPSFKSMISLKTLMDQGIPHKFGYGCDGIISIATSKKADFNLMKYLQVLMANSKKFNSMDYNCCDYVASALTYATGKAINAQEFIIKGYVTTPNQLYKEISTWPEAIVNKDPGEKINGSFFQERILPRLLPVLSTFQLLINTPYSL